MNGKVLLYQPYMDEIGHFRFFFELWKQHLTASGYDVTGVTGYAVEPAEPPSDVHFVNPAKGRFTRILGTMKGLGLAFRTAQERRIPVIYIQDFEIVTLTLAMVRYRKLMDGKRIVLHQHAGNFEVDASESWVLHLYRRLTRVLFRRLLLNPDVRIIANGISIAEGLERYTGIGAPTVVASTWGTRPGEPTAPSEPNHFLFAGILRKDKNLEGVLDAFSRFGKRDWSLTIAGRPMEYTPDEILGLIRRSGVDATRIDLQLRFIDDDEWASFFSRATYVLIPYKAFNKSNSGPLIDALQYDCIPIVSDFGERGDMVRRLGIGYAFDFDMRTLVALLDRLLAPGHSNDEVLDAIRSVKSDHTWPKILRDLTENHRIFDPS